MESTITNVPDLPIPALNVKEKHRSLTISIRIIIFILINNFTGMKHAISTVNHMNVSAKKDNLTLRVHHI